LTLYLDCNATTPLDPRVQAEIVRCFETEPGNASSPHEFGQRARHLVHQARERIAQVVGARRHEILFTSGATESNNLALLGLAEHGQNTARRHIVSTRIEHKAILEPLAMLRQRGFEITLVPPQPTGQVSADAVLAAVRPDTLLVSVMHVNNETGVLQPIEAIADGLTDRAVYLHVDAAQGFGKDLTALRHPRIDLISISSHKIHGPVGVGALVARRPGGRLPPLQPLLHGGGQEMGLRPGTLPVALICGFGLAAELAWQENAARLAVCRRLREVVLAGLAPLRPAIHGDLSLAIPNVVNVSLPGWDGETVVERLEGIAAVATGSACTSVCATASHVLAAMRIPPEQLDGAIRLSWCHLTPEQQLRETLHRMCEVLKMPEETCEPAVLPLHPGPLPLR
jgi:cysteine desulfurase